MLLRARCPRLQPRSQRRAHVFRRERVVGCFRRPRPRSWVAATTAALMDRSGRASGRVAAKEAALTGLWHRGGIPTVPEARSISRRWARSGAVATLHPVPSIARQTGVEHASALHQRPLGSPCASPGTPWHCELDASLGIAEMIVAARTSSVPALSTRRARGRCLWAVRPHQGQTGRSVPGATPGSVGCHGPRGEPRRGPAQGAAGRSRSALWRIEASPGCGGRLLRVRCAADRQRNQERPPQT